MHGIVNWRDVGAEPDSAIAPGKLFRSANLSDATRADVERIHRLGIDTIVDLRRPHERRAKPNPDFGPEISIITSDVDDAAEPPHIAFLRQSTLTPAATEAYMLDYYRGAPYQPRHLALFAAMFTRWRTAPGALLVHCAAGKDRTGLAIALIQSAMGASRAAILAEYLRSNEVAATPEQRVMASRHLAGILGKSPPDFVVEAFLSVSGEHLAAALASIDARSGSLAGYVAQLEHLSRATCPSRAIATPPA